MDVNRRLCDAMLERHPLDTARVLERLPAEDVAELLAETSPETAAEVLRQLNPESEAACFRKLPVAMAGKVLARFPFALALALSRRLPQADREAILEATPPEVAASLRRQLARSDRTAGELVDPTVLAIAEDILVGDAFELVRNASHRAHYYLYIVDRQRRLVGVLNMRELMLAPADVTLAAVMKRDVISVRDDADYGSVLAHHGWRMVHALPLVDEEGRFLGVIRYQTLRRLEEEALRGGRGSGPLETFLNVGEMYWTGLFGLFSGVMASRRPAAGRDEATKS